MKNFLILLAFVVAICVSQPVNNVQRKNIAGQSPGQVFQGQVPVEHVQVPVGIISQDSEVNPDGSFHNVWESENGIRVQEEASVKLLRDNTVVQTVVGQVSYVDPEGTQVVLRYVADENGFHPEGEHLPTPPPVPTGIARGLEWIQAHPPVEETKPLEETPTQGVSFEANRRNN
ncbi:pupal cuticle protein Edg-78E [Fopius arisanus]|uniref:LCP17_1 protein n=1 Tax=Fopius arisanus TaxID=64838 RepID=A0A0C9RJ29_9HYME|nr:PREDICTED: pupal cuticle protein Edg-78E-like [Fopius arisanus]